MVNECKDLDEVTTKLSLHSVDETNVRDPEIHTVLLRLPQESSQSKLLLLEKFASAGLAVSYEN